MVVGKVQVVNVSCESSSKGNRHLRLEEFDHGIRVGSKSSNPTPFRYPPDESTTFASDKISYDLTIQACDYQRQVCSRHQENAMAHQQSRFLAVPSRYHDAEKAKELVKEGQVQTRFRMRRWDGKPITEARRRRRIQEQPSMSIKRGGFGRMYRDL